MNVKFLSLFLAILFSAFSFSQSEEENARDSIKKLLKLSTRAINDYEYNKAIDYSLSLIELASKKEDPYYLYHGYNNLGITYDELLDTLRAKNSYEKALEYAEIEQNDTLLWWAYNNLGNMFTTNKETVEWGFNYYDKAIEVASQFDDPDSRATPILNKGWTHLDMKEYDKAYPYLKKVRDIVEEYEDPYIHSQLASLFGIYHSGKNNYEQSKEYFEEAIRIAEKDSLYMDAVSAYKGYAEVLFKNEEFERAYNALEKYNEYDALLYEKEKLKQMETAQARFETNQYRENLERARREQIYKDQVINQSEQISLIMLISISVMLLFIILLIRNNRARKKLILELKEKNSELFTAKEEAERLSNLKSRFFSTVSHELRTPLYGVVGLTSLLLEDNNNKKLEGDLKSLKFSADYLLALINDVLQMNKMESRLVSLENTPFNIHGLMKGIVKSFEFTRHQNNNTVELQISENIPRTLIGDSVRLSQIIMNLVGNAVKFTERGKVWIKATCKNCEDGKCLIYFEVGDTGMGIPENKQQEIFEEFSQLRANNYNYQGTGLGLPIVRNLLKLFGSEIHLESKEGEGSVFSFAILFAQGGIEETDVQGGDSDFSEESILKKALIVDDNRINQVVTRRIMEKRQFTCKVAGDGYQAIEMLKKESFGVVLMDVNMPGISGMETTQKIREFNPDVPIIALTAVEIQEMREEILNSGMNDIIIKPYDIPTFFNTIFRNLKTPVNPEA
ncbi:tetratricopeptide repeat-containing hybrid sensor histidine kinase/response regulator [Salinimicrobium terrae]|uniref:tetratricopeptide repeat-containing hybrid sensor histidine kinase/response regulator n=1 Tax=Salinimicrobium terrae TaxID=470866 RepID=UPI00041B3DF8|nr:response regulator [Salinimicrobium terrae]